MNDVDARMIAWQTRTIPIGGMLLLVMIALLSPGCSKNPPSAPAGSDSVRIASFTPTSGLLGSEVVITGSGFGSDREDVRVTFGGVLAEVRSASPDRLVVVVPEQARTSRISVGRNGTSATSADSFRVVLSPFSFSSMLVEETRIPLHLNIWEQLDDGLMHTHSSTTSEERDTVYDFGFLATNCPASVCGPDYVSIRDTVRFCCSSSDPRNGNLVTVTTATLVIDSTRGRFPSLLFNQNRTLYGQSSWDSSYMISLHDLPFRRTSEGWYVAELKGQSILPSLTAIDYHGRATTTSHYYNRLWSLRSTLRQDTLDDATIRITLKP